MSRLRTAIVTPGRFALPSPKSSSVERVVLEAGERLGQLADVTVVGKKTSWQPAQEVRDGLRFVRVAGKSYLRRTAVLLRRERPDIIQVENRPRYVRYLKRHCPHARIVLSLHSTTFVSRPYLSGAALRSCLSAADAIVVNSHDLKAKIAAHGESLRSKLVVNHLGVNTERFVSRWSEAEQAAREAELAHLGLSGKQIVLYAGRFIPMKGVHHLLGAMPAIAAMHPNAVLLLVGGARYGSNRPTPYVRRLKRMAEPLREHVRFMPFAPHERMPAIYRLADVLVVPSSEREAFGLVNVEAMATGVPVVATASGGMKEIVEHGHSGLLIDPNAVVEELVRSVGSLLADLRYARYLGENGIDRVRSRFTWQQTAERLQRLYARLVAGEAPNGGEE